MPSDERRRQIMEAALPVFAEKGFKGTTNRDIAQAAGIAPGLIYWYFKSKEDLFNAILDEFSPLSKATLPLDTMIDVPPEQLLPMLLQGIASMFQESQIFLVVRLSIAESLHSPSEGKRINAIFKRLIDPLSDYFRAQIAMGRLRDEDPLLMAQLFFSNIGIFFLRRQVGLDPTLLTYDPKQLLSFTVDWFLRAFSLNPSEKGG